MKKTLIIALFVGLSVSMSACSAKTDTKTTTSAKTQTIESGGSLEIPLDSVSKTPSYYTFDVDGVTMEVVALEASDGTIRTAYNTCQVCNGSPKAYFQQKGTSLQCQNCMNQFPLDKVGLEKGGCNPAPITDDEKTVTDDAILIAYDTLKAESGNFANWKKGLK